MTRNRERKGSNSIVPAVFLLVALFVASGGAWAFKVQYHDQIAEEELRKTELGFDVASADEVGDSAWLTDIYEAGDAATHADANRLDLASARLTNKKTLIVSKLAACQRYEALDELGKALHTVHDIFAHSNFIENNFPIANILDIPRGTATCDANNNFAPGGLVTHYFSMVGWVLGEYYRIPRGQCIGKPDDMCCHLDLAKDAPDYNSERPGMLGLFNSAMDKARDYTRTYVNLVLDDIDSDFPADQATQLKKMFKNNQRTTYFVIDDTGSMSDDISAVKSEVNELLDNMVAGDEAPALGLVTFKDSATNYGQICDITAFRSQINALSASGGGDCPEASNEAMLSALDSIPLLSTDNKLRGGQLVVATDASAGNPLLGLVVKARAWAKGVKISSIVTGDCVSRSFGGLSTTSAVSSNEPGQTIVKGTELTDITVSTGDPLTSPSSRIQFQALAQQTGGVFFNVSRAEVDSVTGILLELDAPDTAVFFSQETSLNGVTEEVLIPVDNSFDQVTFMVTTSDSSVLPVMRVWRPDGSEAVSGDPDVTESTLSSVATITVENPASGDWKVELTGTGTVLVRAYGGTPFRLSRFHLFRDSGITQRNSHELIPVQGALVAGSTVIAEFRFTTIVNDVSLELVRPDGSVIAQVPLTPSHNIRSYRATFTVPDETFVLRLVGGTVAGDAFVRDVPVVTIPMNVGLLVSPLYATGVPGSHVAFDVIVHNASDSEATYDLTATSSLNWTTMVPSPTTVQPGDSLSVTAEVLVPSSAPNGTVSEITFQAIDTAGNANNNSIVAQLTVELDQDGDGISDRGEQGPSGLELTYDGNNDGIPDKEQANVASSRSFDLLSYATLEGPTGTRFSGVRPVPNPSPEDTPAGFQFLLGFFEFVLEGLQPGGTANVILYTEIDQTNYFRYGPEPGDTTNHWYDFGWNGSTGATFSPGMVSMMFIDGQRGDDDLTADSRIVDAGGPALPTQIVSPNPIPVSSPLFYWASVVSLGLLGFYGMRRGNRNCI